MHQLFDGCVITGYADFCMYILNKINSRTLKWAAGLTAFYFLTLHPISGAVGGALFLLTYWAVPSVVNLLVSYHLAFNILPLPNRPCRFIMLVSISLLLGLNLDLIRVFQVQSPQKTTIEILKPLHSPDAQQKNINIYTQLNFENPGIKRSLVNYFKPDGQIDCKCMYFVNPPNLLWFLQNDFENLLGIESSKFRHVDTLKTSDYALYAKTQLQKKELLLVIELKDKHGGHIRINTHYPKYLWLPPGLSRVEAYTILQKEPYFWSHAVESFFNNNIWHWLLESTDDKNKEWIKYEGINYLVEEYKFHRSVKTPFQLLNPEERKNIFKH